MWNPPLYGLLGQPEITYPVNAVTFDGVRYYKSQTSGASPEIRTILGSVDFYVPIASMANFNTRQLFWMYPFVEQIDDGGDIYTQTTAVMLAIVQRFGSALNLYLFHNRNNGADSASENIAYANFSTSFDAWHNLCFHLDNQSGIFSLMLDGVAQDDGAFSYLGDMTGGAAAIDVGGFSSYAQGSDLIYPLPLNGRLGEVWLHGQSEPYGGSALELSQRRMNALNKPKNIGLSGVMLTGENISPQLYLRRASPDWKDNQGAGADLYLAAGSEAPATTGPSIYGV